MRESLLPEPQDNFGTQVALSSEPQGFTQLQKGCAVQIDTHQPTEASEPSGSSSKARSECHIASSGTHLTVIYTVFGNGESRHYFPETAKRKASLPQLQKSRVCMNWFVGLFVY